MNKLLKMTKLLNILENWSVKFDGCSKRMEVNDEGRDWHFRYFWKASNFSTSKKLQCEWEGFKTQKGCVNNLIKTVISHKEIPVDTINELEDNVY